MRILLKYSLKQAGMLILFLSMVSTSYGMTPSVKRKRKSQQLSRARSAQLRRSRSSTDLDSQKASDFKPKQTERPEPPKAPPMLSPQQKAQLLKSEAGRIEYQKREDEIKQFEREADQYLERKDLTLDERLDFSSKRAELRKENEAQLKEHKKEKRDEETLFEELEIIPDIAMDPLRIRRYKLKKQSIQKEDWFKFRPDFDAIPDKNKRKIAKQNWFNTLSDDQKKQYDKYQNYRLTSGAIATGTTAALGVTAAGGLGLLGLEMTDVTDLFEDEKEAQAEAEATTQIILGTPASEEKTEGSQDIESEDFTGEFTLEEDTGLGF